MANPEDGEQVADALLTLARKIQAIGILLARRDVNCVGKERAMELYSMVTAEFMADELIP